MHGFGYGIDCLDKIKGPGKGGRRATDEWHRWAS